MVPAVDGLLAGLPSSVRAALASPPWEERSLLELEFAWPELEDAEALVASGDA
jgi:hypothetical protein